jgi:hypothetical protein
MVHAPQGAQISPDGYHWLDATTNEWVAFDADDPQNQHGTNPAPAADAEPAAQGESQPRQVSMDTPGTAGPAAEAPSIA